MTEAFHTYAWKQDLLMEITEGWDMLEELDFLWTVSQYICRSTFGVGDYINGTMDGFMEPFWFLHTKDGWVQKYGFSEAFSDVPLITSPSRVWECGVGWKGWPVCDKKLPEPPDYSGVPF